MTLIVRDVRPDDPADAGAVLEVRRAALPYLMMTQESLRFRARTAHPAEAFRMLVVERTAADGPPVPLGAGEAYLAHDSPVPGQAYVNLQVHPERRGLGAGSLLLRAAEEHLAGEGAQRLHAWVLDAPSDREFAERRGYRPSRSAHFQHLDLAGAELSAPGPLPAGVRLRTADAYTGDPRPLFEADAEATADEPGDVVQEMTDYEDWLRHTWRDPRLDRSLTTVVEVDGLIAAYSLAHTDGQGRYWSAMTGARRAFRGRGLARLAKTDSLRRARAAGLADAFTGNDSDNGPMLAINRSLGYRHRATEMRYIKDLGETSAAG